MHDDVACPRCPVAAHRRRVEYVGQDFLPDHQWPQECSGQCPRVLESREGVGRADGCEPLAEAPVPQARSREPSMEWCAAAREEPRLPSADRDGTIPLRFRPLSEGTDGAHLASIANVGGHNDTQGPMVICLENLIVHRRAEGPLSRGDARWCAVPQLAIPHMMASLPDHPEW